MCQYENMIFPCGHDTRRLIKHCHFARNDPNHQCFGAWTYKRIWERDDTEECPLCPQNRTSSNTNGIARRQVNGNYTSAERR
ncbi:hypothetical protein GQ43DRAFT_392479 [Delitschia confertaspora ATCC 74209]|uniref:Uncharacterized protein n=1 Tax=Delitschia confertaspora ATCC 74209 TaxID=1513339 RepID=A0A9P4MTN7_9PLEO|nr:hypothetical protein GQ43DRAFT_392479 [Delitschia confertaspora ATCC 74209]